jgi:fermentation-respiration switch protein FrsA (DUF1100 family)
VEDVHFQTADGLRLHGWWAAPPDDGAPVVLWTHGNSGNITHRARMFEAVRKRGWGVLIFDYRGYGKSDPTRPTEEGVYRDAEAAWEFLVNQKGIDPKRIIVFGVSLGAAPATELVLRRQCSGLILKTPFTSIPDMGRFVVRLPVTWLVKHRYDNLAKIPQINMPLLVVHGTADRVVPFEHGWRLFQAAKDPKRFFRVEGADHSEIWSRSGRALLRHMMEFMGMAGFAKTLAVEAIAEEIAAEATTEEIPARN